MGHITARDGYDQLVERLNRFPQGAPPTETLYKILGILFDEEEAALVSKLPIQGFMASEAAKRWGMPEFEAAEILDRLSARALLIDYEIKGEKRYAMPPPMAGWIEFSMMRMRDDIDQHELGQLLHTYMNVEEDFVKALFFGIETKMVRTFVNEPALDEGHGHSHDEGEHGHSHGEVGKGRDSIDKDALEIMDYERASHVIKTATHIGISTCYCRHKMEHVGQNCDAPMDICMTFGNTADSLIRANFARRVDVDECMSLLQVAYDNNLVQIGENVENQVAFICNCCGCCCEALLAAKKFGTAHTIATTSFLPVVAASLCKKCGKCIKVCPLDALGAKENAAGRIPELDEDMCLGCGVCVRNCSFGALKLEQKPQRLMTPKNTVHRVVLTAIDKGMLANLIFDNQDLASHRVLASIVNAILSLPPAKQLLANEQIRSKYILRMLNK